MAYLRLFHGRRRGPDGEIPSLDDWGFDGPVFGPFPYFHGTHAAEINFGNGCVIPLVEGFAQYAGVYYADWSVLDDALFESRPSLQALHAEFDPQLALRTDLSS